MGRKKYKYDPGDCLANHPREFTVRAIWSGTAHDIPVGMKGVQVKRDSDRDVRYLLVPREQVSLWDWIVVIDPEKFETWKTPPMGTEVNYVTTVDTLTKGRRKKNG